MDGLLRRAQSASRTRRRPTRADTVERLQRTFDLLQQWLETLEAALRDPSARECNDGVDNRDPEDSVGDFGSTRDPGCVMPLDNDEADTPMPLTCPNPGETATAVGTINIDESNTLERFILSLPPPEARRAPARRSSTSRSPVGAVARFRSRPA